MEEDRRNFLISTGAGLVSLLFERQITAEEQGTKEIIMPSLEEITKLLSQPYNEILGSLVKEGKVKKFEYTNKTTPEEFYKSLKLLENNLIFGYFTTGKNVDAKIINNDQELNSGSAIIFLYTLLNLKKSNSDVKFIYIEINDFYGEENWRELLGLFDRKRIDFPSFVEFKYDNGRHRISDVVLAGTKNPKLISVWIDGLVKDYRKRSSSK